MKHVSTLLAAGLFALVASPAAAVETWKPSRLWVTGTDTTLWIAGKDAGESAAAVVQMWQATGDTQVPRQTMHLPPVSGDPLYVGADAQALHVLFSNLSACDYFGNRPYSPGALWRGECRGRPLAWAGDATQPIFWALVDSEQLETPTSREGETEDGEAAPAPTGRLTLLQLQSGAWQRLPAPDAAVGASARWLTGRDGNPRLFWTTAGKLQTARREGKTWSAPLALPIDAADVRYGWAGTTPDGAAFVAGKRVAAEQYELRLLSEKDGQWKDNGAIREGNEALIVNPEIEGVGIGRGQVAVARPGRNGQVEFGFAPIGVSPALRFSDLSISREDFLPRSHWEDAITLGLCLGVMTMAIWTRRELAIRVLPMPAGFMPAMVWKRALGGVLDMIPAMLVSIPWWYPKMAAMGLDSGRFFTPEELSILENQLRPERYGTLAAYGLWCFLWELFIARTPGKILLGCRVISVDGTPPSARQCLVRNLVRTLMVSLGAAGLMVTLMTIVIVTRNRQRTGDLLAQTLVIEPGVAPPPEEPAREDDLPGPFD